jgi:hypothetical protein
VQIEQRKRPGKEENENPVAIDKKLIDSTAYRLQETRGYHREERFAHRVDRIGMMDITAIVGAGLETNGSSRKRRGQFRKQLSASVHTTLRLSA